MEDAFMKTTDACVGYFGVDAERGLSQRQVEDNRKKYGPNGELDRNPLAPAAELRKLLPE